VVSAGRAAAASLAGAVRGFARGCPAALAVGEPGLELSYGGLAARAGGLSQVLASAGVAPGDTVAAAVHGLSDLAVAAVASSALGAVLYPLDIRALLEARAARMGVVAASAIVLAGVPDGPWTAGRDVIHLDEVPPAEDPGGEIAAQAGGHPGGAGLAAESERADAVLRLGWPGLFATASGLAARLGLTPHDRLLVAALPHADLTFLGLVASLLSGGAVISPGHTGPQGDGLCRAIRAHSVTVLAAAARPAVLLAEIAKADRIALPSLRSVLIARDRAPQRLPAALRQAAGPELEIRTGWGSAECGVIAAVGPACRDGAEFGVPLGAPPGDQQAMVLGATGTPAASGELCYTGTSVTDGYLGRPDLDHRFFHRGGPGPAYRTGYRARLGQDGQPEFGPAGAVPGPADSGGQLRAIELLIEAWPAVRLARVVMTSHRQTVAFAETVTGSRIDPGRARADLGARMRDAGLATALLPALVVTLPGLPVTASGMVHVAALAARAERLTGPGAAAGAAGPEGPEAARILAAVAGALGIPNLAPDMNLFEAGATSLEIVRVVAELEAELDFDVALEELLDAPFVLTLIGQYHAAHPPRGQS
jgi:nonribosomal peptide synthetase protein BlmIII